MRTNRLLVSLSIPVLAATFVAAGAGVCRARAAFPQVV